MLLALSKSVKFLLPIFCLLIFSGERNVQAQEFLNLHNNNDKLKETHLFNTYDYYKPDVKLLVANIKYKHNGNNRNKYKMIVAYDSDGYISKVDLSYNPIFHWLPLFESIPFNLSSKVLFHESIYYRYNNNRKNIEEQVKFQFFNDGQLDSSKVTNTTYFFNDFHTLDSVSQCANAVKFRFLYDSQLRLIKTIKDSSGTNLVVENRTYYSDSNLLTSDSTLILINKGIGYWSIKKLSVYIDSNTSIFCWASDIMSKNGIVDYSLPLVKNFIEHRDSLFITQINGTITRTYSYNWEFSDHDPQFIFFKFYDCMVVDKVQKTKLIRKVYFKKKTDTHWSNMVKITFKSD